MQIYAVGETILDIIFKGVEPQTAKPGGSSFNASITLGRLGAPVHFISEMGNDRVGDIIEAFMTENGVEANYVSRYRNGQSAIALAFLDENSDAQYQFFKDYPLQRLDVEFPDFQEDDLLMFGSFYSLNPGIRPRVKILLEKARKAGATIIYDPNFRSSHAAERDDLLSVIIENMRYSTLVRASDEDLLNIFECGSPDEAWEKISPYTDILVYTANAGGVYLRTPKLSFHMDVERIVPVSTIGAGDTFNAGILYGLYRNGYSRDQIRNLGQSEWMELISGAIEFSREVCLSYENYLPVEYARRIRSDRSSKQK